ncbi:Uncharacterised protein [uncultured archaeon]|nr:Uncharacterised protein [uncultured archaeon]
MMLHWDLEESPEAPWLWPSLDHYWKESHFHRRHAGLRLQESGRPGKASQSDKADVPATVAAVLSPQKASPSVEKRRCSRFFSPRPLHIHIELSERSRHRSPRLRPPQAVWSGLRAECPLMRSVWQLLREYSAAFEGYRSRSSLWCISHSCARLKRLPGLCSRDLPIQPPPG